MVEWIPVTDRLPPFGKNVLLYTVSLFARALGNRFLELESSGSRTSYWKPREDGPSDAGGLMKQF